MNDLVSKLFWIDMEMTGLDVTKEVIIEVAAIVTDLNFAELDRYHAIVRQPSSYLEKMDEWNRTHHGASGLTALVPTGQPQDEVEKDLISLIEKHFAANERAVLAGNSINQDRLFIERHMPTLAKKLHYRMLDVTAWKILMKNKFHVSYKKSDVHRAVDDIVESINEMKAYLEYVKV